MTSLKQNFKALLSEMETFLVETLKGVKLSKTVTEQKERLVGKVRHMMDDLYGPSDERKLSLQTGADRSSGAYENADKPAPGEGSDGSFSGAQPNEDQASGEGVVKVAASDLKNKFQSGLLEKKKRSGLKTWESVYCIVSGNMFYVYKKDNDKKQKEAFCLTGYEFNKAPNLGQDTCFELTKPGSLPHQFRGACQDGMNEWKQSIIKGTQFVDNAQYENAHLERPKASRNSVTPQLPRPALHADKGDDYEIYDEVTENAYYTECKSSAGEHSYMNPQFYENTKATVYDAMGQAPAVPKERNQKGGQVAWAASQKGGPVAKEDNSQKGGRPKSIVRSSKLPQWPPPKSVPDDSDEKPTTPASPASEQATSPNSDAPPPLPSNRPPSRPGARFS